MSYNARIYSPVWKGYGNAKKEGVNRASHEWILSIDADEEITPDLRHEIQKNLENKNDTAGYYIPRKTRFLGRWIKHCGWYPDYVLRLFDKTRGDFNDAVVHEKVIVNGKTTYLKNEILHYSYPSLEEYFRKFNKYTTLGAEESFKRGNRAGWFDVIIKPPVSFARHYIMKQGYLDGVEGFLVSVLSAVAVMVKYAKLREMQRTK